MNGDSKPYPLIVQQVMLFSTHPAHGVKAGMAKALHMIHAGRKALVFIALLVSASLAMADVAIPPLKARVTDLTGTLSANEATQLEQKLAAFEARKGSQIAVLIVSTT